MAIRAFTPTILSPTLQVRILSPWFWAIWKTNFKRQTHGPKGHLEHLTRISSIGKSPFDRDVVQVYRTTAEVPDCDYNAHLSNSSYAKVNRAQHSLSRATLISFFLFKSSQNLDQCRMDACIHYFPGFSRTGGVMLLGGGYFQFLKEVCCNISKRDVEWLKARHADPNARNLRDTFLHLRLG
jgi:hypothetical protein